jgi:hypothetical protein
MSVHQRASACISVLSSDWSAPGTDRGSGPWGTNPKPQITQIEGEKSVKSVQSVVLQSVVLHRGAGQGATSGEKRYMESF